MPARIVVTPAGAAQAPTNVVITIPRDVLRQIMASPAVAGRLKALEDEATDRPSDRLRHVLAASVLALAVLSMPFLLGGRRRGGATAVALLAVLAGVTLVRADVPAVRPRGENGRTATAPVPVPVPPGGPQTAEVVIVSGNGPIQVQLSYAARP